MRVFRKVWEYYVVGEIFANLHMFLCCIMPTLIFVNPTLSTVEKYVFSILFLYAPWGIEAFKLLLFIISTFYLGGWASIVSFNILYIYIVAAVFRKKRLKLKCELKDNFSAGLGILNSLYYFLPILGGVMALSSGFLRYAIIALFVINLFLILLTKARFSSPITTIHGMVTQYCIAFLGKYSPDTFTANIQKRYYSIGDLQNYVNLVHELYPGWTNDQILNLLNSAFICGDYSPQWLVAAIIERELGPQDKAKYMKGVLSNTIKS